MDIEQIRHYCLAKKGATEDMAFGPDTLLFRVCNKIFACIDLNRPQLVVLKCEPDYAIELRDQYSSICGAWHWNKKHWNDVHFGADLSDALILQLVDHSYNIVVEKLPKKALYRFPELPEGWYHEHFPETDSLMLRLRSPLLAEREEGTLLLTADFQHEGRGQRGTQWEAAAGKNLLFALRFKPKGIKASDQFLLSQMVALAVADAVQHSVKQKVHIKWPNDIYVGDKKICGMLLEHDLRGNDISNTLVGIGINVNQTAFTGSAPNPISIFQLLGKETDRAALLRQFVKRYLHYLSELYAGHAERLRLAYWRKLYRVEGFHPYKDKDGRFMAEIESLDNDGRLGLRDEAGKVRHYYFKEVAFL